MDNPFKFVLLTAVELIVFWSGYKLLGKVMSESNTLLIMTFMIAIICNFLLQRDDK